MLNMLQLGPQGPEKHFFRDRAAKTWPKGKQTGALKEPEGPEKHFFRDCVNLWHQLSMKPTLVGALLITVTRMLCPQRQRPLFPSVLPAAPALLATAPQLRPPTLDGALLLTVTRMLYL